MIRAFSCQLDSPFYSYFFFKFKEGKLQKYSACFQEPNKSDTLDLFYVEMNNDTARLRTQGARTKNDSYPKVKLRENVK